MLKFGIPGKLAPKKCFCGAKLTEPKVGIPPNYKNKNELLKHLHDSNVWFVSCVTCHTDYVWSFPQKWVERHPLPLLDTKKVLYDNNG